MARKIKYRFDARRFNPFPEYAKMVLDQGIPIVDIAIGMGITPRTIHYWRERGFPSYVNQYATEDFLMERLDVDRNKLAS